MATKQSLDDELRQYNEHLDSRLRERFHVSLKTFKSVKAVTQMVGAAAGIYAMSLGAPPLASFALIVLIISGPETLEYLINQQ